MKHESDSSASRYQSTWYSSDVPRKKIVNGSPSKIWRLYVSNITKNWQE